MASMDQGNAVRRPEPFIRTSILITMGLAVCAALGCFIAVAVLPTPEPE
ncbi:MAG: hypothetical protein ACM3VT_04790 [Solirubrobacterales bacterium]